MYSKTRWAILIFTFFIISCQSKWKSEKEEALYWTNSVIDTSHKILYKDQHPYNALFIFDSLQSASKHTTPYIKAARFGLQSNYHWFFTKNNDSTGIYIDSALAVFRTTKLQKRYPRSYVGFLIFGGEVAFRLGNYTKSNEYFFLAKQSADKYLDPCDRSGFTYNAAMVSYRQQNFAQAASYFKEAYASQATCPVQTTAIVLQQQEIQSNIGLCLIKLKQYDSAYIYFSNALAIADQYKDSLGAVTLDKIRGVVFGNMAKISLAKGNLSEAENLYTKSIALNGRPGYEITDALLNQLQLAEVYQKQNRFQDMDVTLKAVRIGLDTLEHQEGEANWRRLMAEYYKGINEPIKELNFFKDYISIRDSIAANQKQLVQADISRQLKDKEQAVRIAVLTKNNLLNQIFLGVVILLSIMALIIILLIYHNYQRSKKNVAQLINLNSEINRQKAALEAANLEKDRILRVVAHDLRNPIGIAVYVADLALMEEVDEKAETSLNTIKTAAQQALHLTNELLGMNNKEHSKQKENIELVSFVKNIVQLLYYKAAEKGQYINTIISEEFLFIKGDPERLNRMISNLVVNAVKFTPLQGTIAIKIEKEVNMALITITDNGIGISHAHQSTIFDRFTKASKRGTSGEKSFGIGLSICKEIIEEHNGTIQLKSKEGQGSSFYVRLPLTDNM